MKLEAIEIKNFRSIEHVKIEMQYNCNIFIGLNESGKSSILKAISAIRSDFTYNFDIDAKLPTNGNYHQSEPVISYYFSLDDRDRKQILENLFGENIEDYPFTIHDSIFFDNFCRDIELEITLTKSKRKLLYRFNTDLSKIVIKEEIYIPTDQFPNSPMTIPGFGIAEKENVKFINLPDQTKKWDQFQKYFKINTTKETEKEIRQEILSYVHEIIPNVIEWKYNDHNVLSENIDIDKFKADPDTSIPLKNIFSLSGINDPEDEIDKALTSNVKFERLLKHLSEKTTQYLHRVWPEYKNIELIIGEVSKKFHISVKDAHNPINLSQRSDGYRRFIAFLLLIGIPNSKTKDNIIILDEPEISLHPSAVTHLLKEILNLSENNYIFIATHSIFCIDKNNINRHFVIEKNNETTKISQTTYQNFIEEEVLLNALGYSVFDILKSKNILFEGWTDKEVFKILTKNLLSEIDQRKIENIGITWSSSVNKICNTLNKLADNNNRCFIIIADYDNAAISEENTYKQEFPSHTSEFTFYRDYLKENNVKSLTLEDLLPFEFMNFFFAELIKNVGLDQKTQFEITDKSSGILDNWDDYCKSNFPGEPKLLKGYKNQLPEKLNSFIVKVNSKDLDSIFSKYKEFLVSLLQKIER